MANPFKHIVENKEAPEKLKEKVMGDIRTIKLTLDMIDLFAIKSPSSVLDVLESVTKNEK